MKRIEKLKKEEILELTLDLINAFRLVKTPSETALLMQDLLTKSEIKNLAKRLRIAKLIFSGKTNREIVNKLHCSFATVTKVSFWLNQGGEGLKKVIAKLPERYKMPQELPHGPLEFHLPQTLLALAQHSLSKRQTKQLKQFVEKTDEKRILDKSLQEAFDVEFRAITSKKKKEKFKLSL